MKRSPLKARPVSPASPVQRAKATWCVVSGARRDEGFMIDPAHLAARGRGGCNDSLCTVGLRRDLHRLFDDGRLDILGWLLAHGLVDEICHALRHYDGDMPGLLQRLTGQRYVPVIEQEAHDAR